MIDFHIFSRLQHIQHSRNIEQIEANIEPDYIGFRGGIPLKIT